MKETKHARSRRAALWGLVLQIVAAIGANVLAITVNGGSHALGQLSFILAAGIPIWFAVLLVFRQHELADLEAMDLEELRREKKATGGGEGIFADEGGGGIGFMIARTRLEWMIRWLLPVFGLITAVVLISLGVSQWLRLQGVAAADWVTLGRIVEQDGSKKGLDPQYTLIFVTLLLVVLVFYSRYTAGLARVAQWQLLRGAASFMFAGSMLTLAVVACFLAFLVAPSSTITWHKYVAFAIPLVMVILGAEAAFNLVADTYRPKSPGVEPRAAFDSRLLGMISEPGGIAHSLAEAINYQFGFEVSQTWFYQLLQRTLVPLLAAGVLAVWLLSSVVIVQPFEHAIIERFGRQVDPEHPLGPGVHLKWPSPFSVARKYNTDQLHEFMIGFKVGFEPLDEHDDAAGGRPKVELWSDPKHAGRDHFNFIVAPTPSRATGRPVDERPNATRDASTRASVHLVRMYVLVQYKLLPQGLKDYSLSVENPDDLLRAVAWQEVVRFNTSSYIDDLMGPLRSEAGEILKTRIASQIKALNLGIELVHVGLISVHPEQTVAEAFRKVVTSQQERIKLIRAAMVEENRVLSEAAGDKRRAQTLAEALDHITQLESRRNDAERALRGVEGYSVDRIPPEIEAIADSYRARMRAQWARDQAARDLAERERDFDLGIGGSMKSVADARLAAAATQQTLADEERTFQTAFEGVRSAVSQRSGAANVDAILALAEIRYADEFWRGRLEAELVGLEGRAAVTLAEAQARRWQREMRAAAEVARVENERYAFNASPRIYKARQYLDVLVEGLKKSRKYFLAFRPDGRNLHLRLNTEEQARPDLGASVLSGQ